MSVDAIAEAIELAIRAGSKKSGTATGNRTGNEGGDCEETLKVGGLCCQLLRSAILWERAPPLARYEPLPGGSLVHVVAGCGSVLVIL